MGEKSIKEKSIKENTIKENTIKEKTLEENTIKENTIKENTIKENTLDEKIARINELYHKSKAEGLTEVERKEQQALRSEYVANIRANLRGQLNNVDIQEKDGSITNLGGKYGDKAGH